MNDDAFTTADIRSLIEINGRELALKEKEIDLEKSKLKANQTISEHQLSFAQQQLEAIERDKKNAREYEKSADTKRLITFGLVAVLVFIFLITAIINDKDTLVIEILKVALYGGSGCLGGYSMCRNKQHKDNDTQTQ